MGDYSRVWAEDEARQLAAHIERTAGRLESLAERYVQMRALLAPAGGAPADDSRRAPGPAGPRVPLRVEVLDTMGEIERYCRELLPLVRGTLRLGPMPAAVSRRRLVLDGLGLMRSGLGGVYAEDSILGDDVSRGAWQLERRAGWIFGDRSRAFALADPCEDCGLPALWVVPERMLIRCGNPSCKWQRPVDAVLPVHISQTGETSKK